MSLVRRTGQGYELLAVNGLDDVGGVDLDDLLIKLIGAAVPPGAAGTWRRLVTPTTTAELRQFTQFCEDVRTAKEALSRQLTVGVHIPLVDQDVHIGRETLKSAAEPLLAPTVDVTADLLAASGDHDRDKTSDVHTTKKFNAAGSGTYWAQVQITSPVTVTSYQATVHITCTP